MTGLTPFWDSSKTFWKSTDLYDAQKRYYDTEKLGYVYPTFSNVDRSNHTQVRHAAKKVMNNLLQKPQNSIFKSDPTVTEWWNWSVRIRVRRIELGRSFTVLVFLGSVPADPAKWFTSKNLVGKSHVFASRASGSCKTCPQQNNVIYEGFVHLNRGFGRLAPPQIKLPYNPEAVVPYLDKNLHWRTVDVSVHVLRYLG